MMLDVLSKSRFTLLRGSIHVHTESVEFYASLFISTVRPTVHTNPSENGVSKTLFKPEEFENAGFHFKNGAFRNDDLM